MSVAIKVENLSKAYQLGQFGTGTLSHDLNRWWALKRGRQDPYLKIGEENNRSSKGESNVVWSLKDINFEIEQGSAVGIIGKNGAGKSTLLKILSQVTAPTYGKIGIKGRIASLLEVGTGFHPELSGRENIYLNGAILGMRKSEIDRKFDQIVDFAGVERYIDTPVKRYSSGMYVRLAFGVAAHLESEILIVDEVLAVGDADFQRKCLGKMGEISNSEGRTILFVSHNLNSITQLCNSAILLKNGKVSDSGNTNKIINSYLFEERNNSSRIHFDSFSSNNSLVKMENAWISNELGNEERCFFIGQNICINIEIFKEIESENLDVCLSVQISTSEGMKICNMVDIDSGFRIERFKGSKSLRLILNDIRLYPDTYFLSFWLGSVNASETFHYVEEKLSFEVLSGGPIVNRDLPKSAGLLYLTPIWKVI
jgi:lipopolysaccharide transport system ATP-binding protein